MMVDLVRYEGKYKINESGIVVNKHGHVMRSAVSNSGYLRVALEKKDSTERVNESIHRLVAETFIPNPDNLPIVMHIDNDKLNIHKSNLKWGTQSENIQQAFDEGRKESPRAKQVYAYEVYNEESGESFKCKGRSEVSDMIGYSEISLKNMIGNDREIALGPYQGFKIRNLGKVICPVKFNNTSND